MISTRRRLRRLARGAGDSDVTLHQSMTQWITHHVDVGPRRAAACTAAVIAAVTMPTFGPVAAILAAGYSVAGLLLWHRWRGQRTVKALRAAAAQQVYLLGADMRAGATACRDIDAVAADLPGGDDDATCQQLRRRLTAVAALSERLGMPTATLLDHFVKDVNTRNRLAGLLAGQIAGTMASARLLACLPIMGLLLGEAMGAAPVAFLLHTPLGAACALTAAGLQALGTRWARHLATVETEVLS